MKSNWKDKSCLDCGELFAPTGPAAKRCQFCSEAHKTFSAQSYHKEHYIPKGYNQKGIANNNWKTGIGTYRNAELPLQCEKCASVQFLCIHHKDGNRLNNDIINLQRLCKWCHQLEHNCAAALPKDREILSHNRKKFLQEHSNDIVRDEFGKFKIIDYKV